MAGRSRHVCICQTQEKNTAILLAASGGHTDCVRVLVEGGANKEAKDCVRANTPFSHIFFIEFARVCTVLQNCLLLSSLINTRYCTLIHMCGVHMSLFDFVHELHYCSDFEHTTSASCLILNSNCHFS